MAPVHYIPKEEKFERMSNGEVHPVQNRPLPLKHPMELHEGIWGGETIIKGYLKKPKLRRLPRYWVPTLKSTVVYSEILDRHMRLTVTERTLTLIDQHYGFDNYILQTPPADLVSELALKIRREMLLTLVRGTLYPDNPTKRKEVMEKYHQYILPEEEADWFGLTLKEASIKQIRLEEEANAPNPLKHAFRAEFIEYLKVKQVEEAAQKESSKEDNSWLSRVNPFAKE
ncbi:hypothetical protein Pmani_035070 [Petrolisthes manimaculis]|uniref:Large ribosomal subunit protein bL28m n=1 Tax=Petrolisthes manimaculis TaxID=1843537 RepID=A0AAE1NNR3_9EUCA|nr:hypothetical protein Pmani_035070 [Petrolisthes manimaculis]